MVPLAAPPLYRLKRHPFPVVAHFRYCLVLAYAFPAGILEPLLPPGLSLDLFEDCGFLAIALVRTERLRPAGFPAFLGRDFFLSGYRIFTRRRTADGRFLRGLRILRSDTDQTMMARAGNLLTHYAYRLARVEEQRTGDVLTLKIHTPKREADLSLVADLGSRPAPLPSGSPFHDLREARRFAGPLPFTFDYETETDSIIRVQGKRSEWNPQPIAVDVKEATFLDRRDLARGKPRLANAFYLENVPYRWERGVREPAEPMP